MQIVAFVQQARVHLSCMKHDEAPWLFPCVVPKHVRLMSSPHAARSSSRHVLSRQAARDGQVRLGLHVSSHSGMRSPEGLASCCIYDHRPCKSLVKLNSAGPWHVI